MLYLFASHTLSCCVIVFAIYYRREVLAPLQQAEAIDIRRKSDAFGEKVEEFRKFFQQKAPFSVPGAELKLEHVSSLLHMHCASYHALQCQNAW